MNLPELNFEISNVEETEIKEKIGLGNTLKTTATRGLRTVDEVARIVQVSARDVRIALELVEVQLLVAKGEALIDGVKSFQALGLSPDQANSLMNQLRND